MKKEAESKRLVVLHEYQMQASWLAWGLDNMMKQDRSWQFLLYQCSERFLKFVINAQLNTLPTPDNLRRWNANKEGVCGLCNTKHATLCHILAGCPWVRDHENKLNREDRYTWRHNNVLLSIYQAVKAQLAVVNKRTIVNEGKQPLPFLRAGQAPPRTKREKKQFTLSLLRGANDWECNFDVPECRSPGSAYVFPHDICPTPTKIDGYIISRKRRICIGIELTCPMEENLEKWHVIKKEKYDNEISKEAAKNGWRFDKLILEVGARGFVPKHVSKACNQLELPAKQTTNKLSLVAQKCSYVLWINRFNKDFQPWRISDVKQDSKDASL